MKTLWTAWVNYGATGEGQSLQVWIGHAEDGADAAECFAKRFGDYFGRMCEVEAGVIDNEVTRLVVPNETMDRLRRAGAKMHVEYFSQLHVNGA